MPVFPPKRLLFAFALATSAAAVLPAGAAHAQRATPGGRVEGHVVLGPALSARRPRFRPYSDPGRGAVAPRVADESALRDVVLYLEGVPTGTAIATPHPAPALRQRDERFVPHVLPVLVGTRVEFPNEDPVFHNVFSLSGAKTFDLGRYPAGSSKGVLFEESGVVQVFCHIHSDMSAVVLVLDTPAFAVPDADGRYAIDGVPPGDYILVAWHERTPPLRRRVHVDAGGTLTADFNIPIREEAR